VAVEGFGGIMGQGLSLHRGTQDHDLSSLSMQFHFLISEKSLRLQSFASSF